VHLPWSGLEAKRWTLSDQLAPAVYEWNGDDLLARGLYLEQRPWQAAVYALTAAS
jgi:hypothetical protein